MRVQLELESIYKRTYLQKDPFTEGPVTEEPSGGISTKDLKNRLASWQGCGSPLV
jgi:hypothetical protein